MKSTPDNQKTKTVTILSLWTRRRDPKRIHQYDVSVPAAQTVEDILEAAYAETNRDGRPLAKVVCSTTAGDVMTLDGTHYLVAGTSFRLLTGEEVTHEIELADTLDWYEWAPCTLRF